MRSFLSLSHLFGLVFALEQENFACKILHVEHVDVNSAEEDEVLVPLESLFGEFVPKLKVHMLPLKSILHLLFVEFVRLIIHVAAARHITLAVILHEGVEVRTVTHFFFVDSYLTDVKFIESP